MPRFRVTSFEGYPINGGSANKLRNWLIVDERGRTVVSYPAFPVTRSRSGQADERARLMALGRCAELNGEAGDAA